METNSRVVKLKTKHQALKCTYCRAGRGCNRTKTSYKRGGGKQPKYKDKR